ncbi:MAG: hypothetical protein ACLP1D_25820 [Xanthobacteraceae bacterium]
MIGSVKTSIDFTSYAMADLVIIDALASADHHRVATRIVLNPRERHDFVVLGDLRQREDQRRLRRQRAIGS